MEAIVSDAKRARAIGKAGHEHVKGKFSRDVFAEQLDATISSVARQPGGLAKIRSGNTKQCALWTYYLLLHFVLLSVCVAVFWRGVLISTTYFKQQ